MTRTVEYKRRLRRLQKKKKRQKCKTILTLTSDVQQQGSEVATFDDINVNSNHCFSCVEENETQRSPKSTYVEAGTSTDPSDVPCHSGCNAREDLKTVKLKYVNMKASFAQTLQEVDKLKKKEKRHEKRLECVEIECQRRINSVRSFWKDKIYGETTRTGRIVKYAMQNNNV